MVSTRSKRIGLKVLAGWALGAAVWHGSGAPLALAEEPEPDSEQVERSEPEAVEEPETVEEPEAVQAPPLPSASVYRAVALAEPTPGPGETSRGGTGSRMDIPLEQLPATVQIMEVQTAQDRGAADMTDALFFMPGVTPAWRYGGFLQVRSRGFNAVMMNDGRRDDRSTFVNSHPQGGLWDLERIEVLKGPASVLYGYGAVGGVVNLVRKRPSRETGYEVDLGWGTPNQLRAHLGATGEIVDGLTYRLDVGHTAREDFRGHETERNQGTLTFSYQPHRDHRFLLRTALYRDQYNTDTGIPTIEGENGMRRLPPYARLNNRYNAPQDFLNYERRDLELGYEWQVSDHVALRERFSYAKDNYAYFTNEGLEYDSSGERAQVLRTFPFFFHHHWHPLLNQLELTARFDTGPLEHKLLVGHDFVGMFNGFSDRASNVFDEEIPAVDFRYPVDTAAAIPIRRDSAFVASMHNNAFFVQDHVSLPTGTHVLVGARLDLFSFESRRDAFDPETGSRTVRGPSDQRNAQSLTYRAGVVQELFQDWSVYASWATAFSPNSRLGLQPAIRDADDNFVEYRQIEPERSNQFEGGIRLNIRDRLQWQMAGYWIRKTHVTIPVAPERFETAGEVRSRGVETDLTWRSRWFQLMAGYALTDAYYHVFVDSSDRDLAGNTPSFVARHGANLWATFLPLPNLGIGIGGRMLGRQFADEANSLKLPGYALADANLWYRVDNVRFMISAQNLLNQRQYFVSSVMNNLTPGMPRELLAQMRWEI